MTATPRTRPAERVADGLEAVALTDAERGRIALENEGAWCGERLLDLTPKAFAILRHFVEHPERLLTKDDLFAAVWGDTVVEAIVDQLVDTVVDRLVNDNPV